VYTVLGSRLAEAKKQREAEIKRKKIEAENVAENWEDDVEEQAGDMLVDGESRRGSVEDAVAAAEAA
jgi:hypothetical protein